MVTFRFYVVSTVAFFLALAVGVLVGSVLDGRIADGLQDRLDGVEASLDDAVAAVDAKNTEIERRERYIEASAPFAVESRLEGTSALVVAESGIDDAAVVDLVQRLRQARSGVQGIVWIEPRADLSEDGDREAAARLVGAEPDADADEVRSAMWRALVGATGAGAPASGSTTTTQPPTTQPPTTQPPTTQAPTTVAGDPPGAEATPTTPSSAAPSTEVPTTVPEVAIGFDDPLLRGLADAGLVRLQSVDGEQPADTGEVVLVAATGAASVLAEPGAASNSLVRAASAAGVPSVLAEVTVPPADGEPERRGELIASSREQGPVRYSTVDDLELIAGRVATVLALADARDGTLGRFGYGPDVDGVLPAWQGP